MTFSELVDHYTLNKNPMTCNNVRFYLFDDEDHAWDYCKSHDEDGLVCVYSSPWLSNKILQPRISDAEVVNIISLDTDEIVVIIDEDWNKE